MKRRARHAIQHSARNVRRGLRRRRNSARGVCVDVCQIELASSVFLLNDRRDARRERVPRMVRARRGRDGYDVGLEHGVRQPVDHRVYADREEVLVVLRRDAARDCCCVRARGGLERVFGVYLQDAGEADLELDVPVLVESVVEYVFYAPGGCVRSQRLSVRLNMRCTYRSSRACKSSARRACARARRGCARLHGSLCVSIRGLRPLRECR